jgi:hypothetical protein
MAFSRLDSSTAVNSFPRSSPLTSINALSVTSLPTILLRTSARLGQGLPSRVSRIRSTSSGKCVTRQILALRQSVEWVSRLSTTADADKESPVTPCTLLSVCPSLRIVKIASVGIGDACVRWPHDGIGFADHAGK